MSRCYALVLTTFAAGLLASPLAAATFTVAPDATQSDQPIRAALAQARTQPISGDPRIIELSEGRYELSQPLEFGPADSGITLRARPGTRPVLSGGTRIRGWVQSRTNPALWEVKLPEVAAGRWYFHQLFLNDSRAQLARTPNTGFFTTRARLGTGSPITLPFRAEEIRPAWASYPDARVVILMKWTDLRLPILGVEAAGVASLAGGPVAAWMDEADARYWIENVPDALDAPGEWYLDRTTGVLRFLAPDKFDPNAEQVVAPRLTELVRVRGQETPNGTVTGLRLEGLTFAESDYVLPDGPVISPQAAVPIPGTLRLEYARDAAIEDCTLENFGGYGIELGRGVQHSSVVGNTLRNLGAGGIRVGDPSGASSSGLSANHSHAITDNELKSLGRIFAPAVGILVFHSGTNRIAHNHISDLYYTGISVGWNWGYQKTPCRANTIEFNLVENIGQGRLSDMGGIYTLGPQPGTVIRNNLFRDIVSHGYGGWGLYTDEGSTGIVLENNVVYRCKSAGFHQHYGRDNLVRNNLIAFNQEHELMRTRAEEHRSFRLTRNVVIWNSGNLLGSDWKGTTNQLLLDHNTYFDTRVRDKSSAYNFAGKSWAEWQQAGQDLGSRIADPLLVDASRPELGLRPESPAYAVGFVPIDLGGLGPRPKGQRRE